MAARLTACGLSHPLKRSLRPSLGPLSLLRPAHRPLHLSLPPRTRFVPAPRVGSGSSHSTPSALEAADSAVQDGLSRYEEDVYGQDIENDEDGIAGVDDESTKRMMSLTFTCTSPHCQPPGVRSTHEFSRLAYEKGIVLVQCPGCLTRHLIADHLGWFGDDDLTQGGRYKTIEDIMRAKGEKVRYGQVYLGENKKLPKGDNEDEFDARYYTAKLDDLDESNLEDNQLESDPLAEPAEADRRPTT